MIFLAATSCTSDHVSTDPASLTKQNVDVAPECTGLLDYTNGASFATLDAYLPSNVARALVDTAAAHPFDSIASLVAVNGVGPTRLQQLLAHARTDGFVGAACDGIYDNLAVSTEDAAVIVAYTNAVAPNELAAVMSFLPFPDSTVTPLLAGRPYANVGAISNTSGVGPAAFRALRNAATIGQPFESLVAVVDSLDHPDGQVRIETHFDWHAIVANERITSITCFGVAPEDVPPGTELRPNLADEDEVFLEVLQTVQLADRFGEVTERIDREQPLSDLGARLQGRSFFGCYVHASPNPFVFDTFNFFVDTAGTFQVLTTVHAVE